jgi:hypothetical protein
MRVLTLGVVLAATALAGAATTSSGAGQRQPFDRTCLTRAEGPGNSRTPPYSRQDVRFGPLFFIDLGREQQWRQTRGADGTLKIPVVLRTGPPVTVRIAPIGRTSARLDFDMSEWSRQGRHAAAGDGQRIVRFHACPRGTRRFTDHKPLGAWTFYPGGFLVDRPGCVRLTATGKGMRTVRRRVALGVPPSRC